MFGLFKTKLSITSHKYEINYLISEEATAQWQYHVQENNFDKNAFRGQPFAKNTVKLFIDNFLKMKVDDKLLTQIVDLGYRKCSEWISDYHKLEKKISKLNYENLIRETSGYLFLSTQLETGIFKDLKFDHQKAMIEGMQNVNFRKRFKDYNVMMQMMRNMDCYTRTLLNHKNTKKLGREELDKLVGIGEKEIAEYSEKKKKSLIEKIKKNAESVFLKRNLNNEVGN